VTAATIEARVRRRLITAFADVSGMIQDDKIKKLSDPYLNAQFIKADAGQLNASLPALLLLSI
jgi:hypothetical protein